MALADYDYHVGQRYHGPGSAVFRDALTRVPERDQAYTRCSQCQHMLFVQKSVRRVSLQWGTPVVCVHCAVEQIGADVNTILNLEHCPPNCQFGPPDSQFNLVKTCEDVR